MTLRWKPALGAIAAALFLGNPLFAQDEAPSAVEAAANPDLGVPEEPEECRYLNSWLLGDCFSEKTGIYIEGWADGGAAMNDNATANNLPVTFDTQQDFMLNQLYFILGRAADTEGCKLDWGFQADVLYGTDARFNYALGLDVREGANGGPLTPSIISPDNTASGIYGVALPQLFGEVFVPVGGGLDIKMGHFYTIIGYEVVTAPDNFFYSHAYTMQYGEPFTHTGVMTTYQLSEKIKVWNGVVRGWDNWIDNNNGVSYLGGVSVDLTDSTTITGTVITGAEQDEPNIAAPGPGWQGIQPAFAQSATLNRTMYSLVLSQKFLEKFTYVFQHDHGWQNGAGNAITNAGAPFPGAEWYGINQYLFYELNDKIGLGVRGEWFRDDDGYRVTTVPAGPGNWYEVTLGVNYKPTACLAIRPELRYDWFVSDAPQPGPFGNVPNNSGFTEPRDTQLTAAVDVILKF